MTSPSSHWRVDFKWIFALLAFFPLCAALFTYGLVRLTERETAIDITTTLIAVAFSPNGLSDETDFAASRAQLRRQGSLQPFPGMGVTITADEVEGLSAREARLHIFRKLAEPLYDEGLEGLAQRAPTKEAGEKFKNDAQLIGALSKENHALLWQVFLGLAGVAVLFLIPAILFSSGRGRLITPAVLLVAVSAVPAAALTIIRFIVRTTPGPSLTGERSLATSVSYAVREITPLVTGAFLPGYGAALALALVLLLLALVWQATTRQARPR